MRLDKYLAQMSIGTRSEVKKLIKSGRVFVNGIKAGKPEQKVTKEDQVEVDGEVIHYEPYVYYMLNKPAGVVSATTDRDWETVVSLIHEDRQKELFPVGRLDRDTEGLLLLTNDGALTHDLLSPAKHVWKTYLVKADGIVTPEKLTQLEQGIEIGDEKPTLPAKARIVPPEQTAGEEHGMKETPVSWIELSIQEGRYHQVKRMMKQIGCPVRYLKRLSMGGLSLDASLRPGEYRKLLPEEVMRLRQEKNR